MSAFRKQSVLVAAFRLAIDPLPTWAVAALQAGRLHLHGQASMTWWGIPTREGAWRAEARDFLIRGIRGEISSRKAPLFYATYEPVRGCDAESPALPRKELPHGP